MARYLFAIVDGGGRVPPALAVAGELIRRGHAVTVADPTVASSARAASCAFRPWRAAPHFASLEEQTALLAAVESGNPVRAYRIARDRLICGGAPGYASDVLSAVHDLDADAILTEVVPGALIGALASARPTAVLMANTYLRPTPGLPLMGTGWQPARGPVGQARDAVAPRLALTASMRFLPPLNAALRAHGLQPMREMFELLDRCAEVLVLTSPSFDLAGPALPRNVRYVGPELADPDWASAEGGDPDARRPNGVGPLVLIAGSSIWQRQTDLLCRAAAALGPLPARGVVTTGRAVDPRDIPAPGNVRVVRAAPHRAVLGEAAVAVTHAGHGSVLKALAAGVPLVCVPMGRDEKDNTVRVQRLRAGVRLEKSASPQQLADAVRRVLDEPAYADAARRFAAVLAEESRSRPCAADRAEALVVS